MRFVKWLLPVAAVAVAIGCGRGEKEEATAAQDLRKTLAGHVPSSLAREDGGQKLWSELRRVYAQRDFKPGWTKKARPTAAWDLLLGTIDEARQHGLDAALYDLAGLRERREKAAPQGLLRRPAL